MSNAVRIFQGQFGRVALLDMDKSLVPHAHSQCHVLIKASGADSAFMVREQRQTLSDVQGVLINTWEPHYYDHQVPEARTLILALYIEPQWLAELHNPLRSSARPNFFPQPTFSLSPRIRSLADQLIGDMLALGQAPRERVESLIFDLMIAVIEPYSDWRNLAESLVPGSLQSPDARINRAIAHIRANVGESLDMEELARAVHLSRAHFFSRFRACTGMTPSVFINMVRMDAACQSLADRSRVATLAQLASDLGFREQGHFTRFLRGQIGVTPSEYRRVVDCYQPLEGVELEGRPFA